MRIKRRDYKIGTEDNSGSLLFQVTYTECKKWGEWQAVWVTKQIF